jgi:hypothetical protein
MVERTRCALLFFAISCGLLSGQEVKTTGDGQHVLHLTATQQAAVDLFLRAHPTLQMMNCPTTGPDAAWCRTSYLNWQQTVLGQQAKPQYQFAAWGDFRGKRTVDFAIPFHAKATTTRLGEIVVFEELGGGHYRPETAITENWGGCFDGMLFHPTRKRIEFWCNSASGYVGWNGTAFVGKILKGD